MIHKERSIIAYYADPAIRHQATSGGIGSGIIKELFNRKKINSAISYRFETNELKYIPRIITDSNSYTVSGSIYHEINLIGFIKENVGNIISPFACFSLPCQVEPIKRILEKHNIESYIIELTCSSQQSYEATEFLIKREGLKKEDISMIRYRGNGWPGGVTITTKGGKHFFFDNNNSIWTKIFHSHLFIMPRCFFCSPTKKTTSDIIIADPWNIDKPGEEKEGRTLCYIKTEKMASFLNEIFSDSLFSYEAIDNDALYNSQRGTIVRKKFNLKHNKLTRITKNLFTSRLYRSIALKNNTIFGVHCFIYKYVFKILHKIEKTINRNV